MIRPVFLYGTLLDPSTLRRCSGDPGHPRRARDAVSQDHARVGFQGTPYPTLVPRIGGEVRGWLIRPGPAALRALSASEGPAYALRPARVATPRGPVSARAWMVPRHMATDRAWTPAPDRPRRRPDHVRPGPGLPWREPGQGGDGGGGNRR